MQGVPLGEAGGTTGVTPTSSLVAMAEATENTCGLEL